MNIILIFLLSRFFNLAPISNSTVATFVYTTLSKVATILIIILYIRNRRISKFMIILLAYYFILFLSTLINNGNVRRLIMLMYPLIGICAFIEISMQKSPRNLLKSFIYILGFLSSINFIFIIINRNLFSDNRYFLGLSNHIALPLIIFSVCLILYDYIYGKSKISTFLFLVINTITIFTIWSGSNIIAWSVFLFSIILINFKTIDRLIAFNSAIIVYIIIYLSIVIFRNQDWSIFKYIIENLLGKDITLTNRTYIWDIVLSSIKEKLFIGYGIKDSVNLFYLYLKRMNKPIVNDTFSAHNQFLQITYEGGLVTLFSIIILMLISGNKLNKYNDKKVKNIITLGIFSILLIMMSETPGIDALIVLLSLAYNSNFIIGSKL